MPINREMAFNLAGELTTIPETPRSEEAIRAIARHLESLCWNESEARWLVNEAQLKWESWRGPHRLAEMLYDRRNPEIPPSNQYKPMPPPEAPTCKLCGDWGHLDDPKSKLRVWCKCEMGVWQAQRHPGLVEALNRFKTRNGNFSKPVTKTESRSTPDWLKTFTEGYK